MGFDVNKHKLVPKHIKLSDSEKNKLFTKFNIDGKEMPKIFSDDSAIVKLNAKAGDIIKVERVSETAGESFYYRFVVDE